MVSTPQERTGNLQAKRQRLIELLREYGSVLIGYSGGVDSVLLARVAVDALGAQNVLAVTGKSESLASWMEDTAREVAETHGIPWLEVETRELDDPRYAANPSNRCYFCKSELWDRLGEVAAERGLRVIADGCNADDVGDHRPGAVAGAQRGVRSPLLEAGLNKAELRAWSRELGLPTWDQPAAPCLASRLPYGIAVTPERLRQIERAELALRRLGFRDFRVRHHEDTARLEMHSVEMAEAVRQSGEIHREVISAGFDTVVLDLEGYRRGSLNQDLSPTQLVQLGSVQ